MFESFQELGSNFVEPLHFLGCDLFRFAPGGCVRLPLGVRLARLLSRRFHVVIHFCNSLIFSRSIQIREILSGKFLRFSGEIARGENEQNVAMEEKFCGNC
jgi:hypothetical protein